MRILVTIHNFELGGAERIALRLASQWATQGEEVCIVSGARQGPLAELVDERVRIVAPDRPLRVGTAARLKLALLAAREARRSSCELIFLPGNSYVTLAWPLQLLRGRKRPPIVLKLSNVLRRRDRGRLAGLLFRPSFSLRAWPAARIVVMSESLLAEARATLFGLADRLSLAPQPVLDDNSRTSHRRNRSNVPKLVAAGRLTAQKNFELLIRAVASVGRPVQLAIYGDGPQRPRLQQLISDLGLRHATLEGYANDLARPFSEADLFVLSSAYEGFPSVLVEALAMGLPVVATDCSPAIQEILGDDPACRLVPPDDADALRSAIEDLLDAPVPDEPRLTVLAEPYRLERSAHVYLGLFCETVAGR